MMLPSVLCRAVLQVCLSTVGVLGDVCRAVSAAIWPYCDELVSIILANLGSPTVHRNIKPELLTVRGRSGSRSSAARPERGGVVNTSPF